MRGEERFGAGAARHLQALRRAGELHRRDGGCRDRLHDHRTAADQDRRAGQDLKRRHPARQRAREGRIGGADGVLDPGVGRVRSALLGDVAGFGVVRCLRHGVGAEVGVHVDEAGREPPAATIDDLRSGWARHAAADGHDPAALDRDLAVIDPLAGAVEDRHAGDDDGPAGQWAIGAGIRIRQRVRG